ncbi:hypothetical protein GUJ93_ZPchr0002g24983 [Zizania palustris]|uniref:protein-serine/threonine phosphatase n=1 Tax=Zizania palustris TaxID=103762 RepID=A0A8J5RYX1_ZIZPA|nr:hypothetical protein GUJ93_ZPchr0002g24983 [Zizania palustris]
MEHLGPTAPSSSSNKQNRRSAGGVGKAAESQRRPSRQGRERGTGGRGGDGVGNARDATAPELGEMGRQRRRSARAPRPHDREGTDGVEEEAQGAREMREATGRRAEHVPRQQREPAAWRRRRDLRSGARPTGGGGRRRGGGGARSRGDGGGDGPKSGAGGVEEEAQPRCRRRAEEGLLANLEVGIGYNRRLVGEEAEALRRRAGGGQAQWKPSATLAGSVRTKADRRMIKSMVFYGNTSIGEVEVWPRGEMSLSAAAWAREIRVDRLSPPGERCQPFAVMHTVAVGARCLVMESRPPKAADEPPQPIVDMHSACLRENKTAVVPLGEEELHLVAMTSRRNLANHACFWGYKVPFGLYNSCLTMLNLRCLGIVFDLDETLIVANTTRSFEDRIDALQRKLSNETDPQRINGMIAEIKRYQDDKSILKQYIEGDQVCDDGNLYKVQSEVVPPLSDNHQTMTRPVIRLQEKNIILTRINPLIRDTSVLVRLRPAWEDLRSYLIARGRKRFEVYVCTMAERDYALEMWRLLDPDSRLINSVQLNDRMVCVKSGLRKSLLNVFHDGSCHPGMALVIDDRLKVWDEKDQSRVHVVPAFTPYYAPQAEANCSIPVLCVARNVACNDEVNEIPSAPDVGNYLILEDENVVVVNGNRDPLVFDGMADAEVERRMKEASGNVQALNPAAANFVMPVLTGQNFSSSVAPVAPPVGMVPLSNTQGPPASFSQPVAQLSLSDPLQGSPAREEGEVPESELDPDTRRRLLILQHGQDTRDPTPPLPVIPPAQASGFPLESETMHYDKKQPPQPFFHGGENPISSNRFSYQNQRFSSQPPHTEDHRMLQNHAQPRYKSFSGMPMISFLEL